MKLNGKRGMIWFVSWGVGKIRKFFGVSGFRGFGVSDCSIGNHSDFLRKTPHFPMENLFFERYFLGWNYE
jgi:hypothetical protein